MNLKYLFTVRYSDSTVFKQPKHDTSATNPKRSAFYDVLNSGKEISSCTLGKLFDNWTVDLETGEFTHNGVAFQLEENPKPGKRTLYFQRQHQHDMSSTGIPGEHRVIYILGFTQGKKKTVVGIK